VIAVGASITADEKRFKTLCADAALRGLAVLRTDAADGPVRVVALRGRQAFLVDRLDDLESLLIGARTQNS